jgi:DNA-binding response OmpR family regulator
VEKDGEPVSLTAREFDLLWFMASNPSRVFSRETLLENVWGPDFIGDSSTVTVHMRHLREKIELEPSSPRHLVTVWGVGYRFDK